MCTFLIWQTLRNAPIIFSWIVPHTTGGTSDIWGISLGTNLLVVGFQKFCAITWSQNLTFFCSLKYLFLPLSFCEQHTEMGTFLGFRNPIYRKRFMPSEVQGFKLNFNFTDLVQAQPSERSSHTETSNSTPKAKGHCPVATTTTTV